MLQDVEVTATIQQELAQANLLPEEQIVDTGYVDADLRVRSQQDYGIKLVGPVLSDKSWQAKAGKGFDAVLTGTPRGQTRPSAFASLATHPKVQRKAA